jgi:hypothetical protein
MQTNETGRQKRAVEQLTFGTKTSKRVSYSEWEFTVVAPFEIEVCNASYGYLKDEHIYRVMIDEQGIPVSCTCPGFKHYHGPNGNAGKHMLAVAAIGGQTLLDAAATFLPNVTPSEKIETTPIADRLKPDGGSLKADTEPETCLNGNDRCGGPQSDELPCFACYCERDGTDE